MIGSALLLLAAAAMPCESLAHLTFADAAIETLDEGELDDYERLLNLPDTDLMDWMLTGKPVPADIDSALIRRILAFRQNMPF